MEKITVQYSHENAVATVTLNDGKGNILDDIMMREILVAYDEFDQNPNIKLIVFEGAGKHFSFGASVEEHQKEFAEAMLKTFHSLFYRMMEMNIPTLAKVSGQCLGGGLELVLGCNFIFTDKTAKLGQPEILLGVFAPPASIILPLKIGNALAEEILITGRTISAEEGLDIGLINKVFDTKEEMNSATDEWIAQYILPKSASSLKFAVKAARTTFNYILGNKLPALEYVYTRQLMETHDANEGIASFIEKRPPAWKNK